MVTAEARWRRWRQRGNGGGTAAAWRQRRQQLGCGGGRLAAAWRAERRQHSDGGSFPMRAQHTLLSFFLSVKRAFFWYDLSSRHEIVP